jgi:hypothetical protein
MLENAMPGPMLWTQRIPDVIAKLESSESKIIDRRTLQSLLGLKKTEAWALMRRWGAKPIGTSLAVERDVLIHALRSHSRLKSSLRIA